MPLKIYLFFIITVVVTMSDKNSVCLWVLINDLLFDQTEQNPGSRWPRVSCVY